VRFGDEFRIALQCLVAVTATIRRWVKCDLATFQVKREIEASRNWECARTITTAARHFAFKADMKTPFYNWRQRARKLQILKINPRIERLKTKTAGHFIKW
jgi:hypothetical protein